MCEATIKIHSGRNGKWLLASLESFSEYDKGGYPNNLSKPMTCIFVIVFLTLIEHSMRQILASLQVSHLYTFPVKRVVFSMYC
jgi:hypothetical protein